MYVLHVFSARAEKSAVHWSITDLLNQPPLCFLFIQSNNIMTYTLKVYPYFLCLFREVLWLYPTKLSKVDEIAFFFS